MHKPPYYTALSVTSSPPPSIPPKQYPLGEMLCMRSFPLCQQLLLKHVLADITNKPATQHERMVDLTSLFHHSLKEKNLWNIFIHTSAQTAFTTTISISTYMYNLSCATAYNAEWLHRLAKQYKAINYEWYKKKKENTAVSVKCLSIPVNSCCIIRK